MAMLSSLYRAATRCVKRKLSRGWTAWAVESDSRTACAQKLRGALHNMGIRKLVDGFRRWHGCAHGSKALCRGIEHLHYRRLSAGWAAWSSAWPTLTRQQSLMLRATKHICDRKLSLGWCKWVQMTIASLQFLTKLRHALTQMLYYRKVTVALANWRSTIHLSKAKRLVAEKHAPSLKQGWARWRVYAVSMGTYLDVASMQFTHVLVRPGRATRARRKSTGESRQGGLRNRWRCSSQDKQDWALLHASQKGHLATVSTLAARGARVGVCDGLGQNALHTACFEGHSDIVEVLLGAQGADLECQDVYGHTPLMLADLRGHEDIVQVLSDAAQGIIRTAHVERSALSDIDWIDGSTWAARENLLHGGME